MSVPWIVGIDLYQFCAKPRPEHQGSIPNFALIDPVFVSAAVPQNLFRKEEDIHFEFSVFYGV